MAVKLVALDIDGTLLPFEGPHEGALSPRLRSAVAALAGRGVAVVLASGRMHPGTARIAQELQLAGPLIAQEGCVVASAAGEVVPTPRPVNLCPCRHKRGIAVCQNSSRSDPGLRLMGNVNGVLIATGITMLTKTIHG